MTDCLGTSLKNDSLVDQIITRITDAILQGELHPGDRMPSETELTESFQVGKSSVREAIKVLQAVGILEVRRGDGTYVSTGASPAKLNPVLYQMMVQPASIDKLLELRSIYEPAYTILAAKNATEEDLACILQAKKHFEELALQDEQSGDYDIGFHRSILQATHNPYIIGIGEMILKILSSSVARGSRKSPRQAVRDHEAIYQAILKKDESAIFNAVMDSFKGWMSAADQ